MLESERVRLNQGSGSIKFKTKYFLILLHCFCQYGNINSIIRSIVDRYSNSNPFMADPDPS